MRTTFAMPVCMTIGAILYRPIYQLDQMTGEWLTPIFVFSMLFLTYLNVNIRQMRIRWIHILMLAVQFIGGLLVYWALRPFGETVAQGGMICIAAPVAMASVIIGSLLGANITDMTSFSLLCNITTAFVAPLLLNYTGNGECTVLQILSRVAPLLVGPFVAGQIFRVAFRKATQKIVSYRMLSFNIWIVSLTILIGRVTMYIFMNHTESWGVEIALALIAMVLCVLQFTLGHWLGKRDGSEIAVGQSMGQKNTMLSIWMSQSFLSPLACIAPTAYIIWQNIVNSYQIYHYRK